MALVASVHVDLGWPLPASYLKDVDGRQVALQDCAGEQGLLVAFTCNHCPYAIAVWPRLIRHAAALKEMGINTVAVNPNIHPDYPADGVAAMAEKITQWGIDFPYLSDEDQSVARDFDAQCTPDLYLFDTGGFDTGGFDTGGFDTGGFDTGGFDAGGKLFYHGRIDDNWKDESKVTNEELLTAAELLLAGKAAPQLQHPSIGCSIKWL